MESKDYRNKWLNGREKKQKVLTIEFFFTGVDNRSETWLTRLRWNEEIKFNLLYAHTESYDHTTHSALRFKSHSYKFEAYGNTCVLCIQYLKVYGKPLTIIAQ